MTRASMIQLASQASATAETERRQRISLISLGSIRGTAEADGFEHGRLAVGGKRVYAIAATGGGVSKVGCKEIGERTRPEEE